MRRGFLLDSRRTKEGPGAETSFQSNRTTLSSPPTTPVADQTNSLSSSNSASQTAVNSSVDPGTGRVEYTPHSIPVPILKLPSVSRASAKENTAWSPRLWLEGLNFVRLPGGYGTSHVSPGPDTLCVLCPETKAEILKLSSWPLALLPLPSVSPYRISKTQEKGLGMFAAIDLNPGDLILQERALLITTVSWPQADIPNLNPAYRNPGKLIGQMIKSGGLDASSASHFYDLYAFEDPKQKRMTVTKGNAQLQEEEAGSLEMAIVNTNSVMLGRLPGEYKGDHCAVCKDLSRINHRCFRSSPCLVLIKNDFHSCQPNATYRFSHRSFSFVLHALCPIKKDEEITISYVDMLLPRSGRQERLRQTYGFECTCPCCSLHKKKSEASDKRRKILEMSCNQLPTLEASSAEMLLQAWFSTAESDPIKSTDTLLRPLLDTIVSMEKESLVIDQIVEGAYATLCKIYLAMEQKDEAQMWARKCAEMCRAHVDEVMRSDERDKGTRLESERWEDVARWPERTPWWGRRPTTRSG
jgi:hypothetical protein